MEIPAPKIGNDLPVPPRRGRGSGRWRFLDNMEVGQHASFKVEDPKEADRLRALVGSAVTNRKKHGKDFTIRTLRVEGDSNSREVVVWRIK